MFNGEGLTADEARDATFLLTGAGTWVGKLTYLAADSMTIQEGKRAIAQAILDHQVKVRGWGHPHVNLLAHHQSDYPPSPHQPCRGQGHNRHRRDQRPQSPQFPSPSIDHGFETDRCSLSTMPLMLSRSDWSDGSRHSRWGRWHQEEAHMKINLPVFKDEDAKDAMTYQSWRWDLNVYRCAGCRGLHLLPYAIRSLQGYPGELVWSSGTDITLDDVLTILGWTLQHCKSAWCTESGTISIMDGWQGNHVGLGCLPFKTFTSTSSFLPQPFPLILCGRAEEGLLLWQTPQTIKRNGSLPEGGSTGENIFGLPKGFQGGWGGRFDSVAPKLQNPSCQWLPKPRTTSFYPLQKLKGNQPLLKKPAICLAHLEEEDADDAKETQRVMILVESRG